MAELEKFNNIPIAVPVVEPPPKPDALQQPPPKQDANNLPKVQPLNMFQRMFDKPADPAVQKEDVNPKQQLPPKPAQPLQQVQQQLPPKPAQQMLKPVAKPLKPKQLDEPISGQKLKLVLGGITVMLQVIVAIVAFVGIKSPKDNLPQGF